MITSRKGKRWVIPKGVIEPDMTPAESAAREAFEEAGIEGELCKKSIGKYTYSKWNGLCKVKVYVMRVNKINKRWLEKSFRQRQWYDIPAATALIKEKKLRTLIQELPQFLKRSMETVNEYHRPPYVISCDPLRLDFNVVHNYLSTAYWSPGVSREDVESAAYGSLCFGMYINGEQVGYARVISDNTVFAYVADVFILEEHRGKGLGKWLMESIMKHPQLQGLRRWMLATQDAHELYEPFGFSKLAHPEIFMEIHQPLTK